MNSKNGISVSVNQKNEKINSTSFIFNFNGIISLIIWNYNELT